MTEQCLRCTIRQSLHLLISSEGRKAYVDGTEPIVELLRTNCRAMSKKNTHLEWEDTVPEPSVEKLALEILAARTLSLPIS
jgi:hypothetical protein